MKAQVLTVPEAGQKLGLGRVSAYRAVRRGEIPALRFGKRLVVPKLALARLLETPARFAAAAQPEKRKEAEG